MRNDKCERNLKSILAALYQSLLQKLKLCVQCLCRRNDTKYVHSPSEIDLRCSFRDPSLLQITINAKVSNHQWTEITMLIHLNGMAGVGKLTVATILASELDARLIDNHLILDLVVAVVGRREAPRYLQMIEELTEFVFEAMEKESDNVTFIMTNCLVNEHPEDVARLDAIAKFAAKAKHQYVQILLTCDHRENQARVVNESRKLKGKLTSSEVLAKYLRIYTMYHPETQFGLQLDTSSLSAEQAARLIADYVKSL